MEYEDKFNEILNTNEAVVKVYKPNKLKYWVSKSVCIILLALFFVALSFSFSYIDDTAANPEPVFNGTVFAVCISVSAALLLLLTIYLIFYYKNLYYCITTQRVLIRRGVFGTDFKTLDMQMIGATNVHVSLLDKIVRHNTGSIVFGSNSAPLMGQGSTFIFKDIVDPYKESKDIKTAIDDYKSNLKSTNSNKE